VGDTMCTYAKGRRTFVFRELLKSLYPSPLEYTTIINDFIYVIAKNEDAIEEMVEHGLID
jgi:hypothetical protein